MTYRIVDSELQRMDDHHRYVSPRFGPNVHRAFRKVMNLIRAARDERDLRSVKSLRLEKLRGDRAGQSSMRLNQQFRLIARFAAEAGGQTVIVIEIVNYH